MPNPILLPNPTADVLIDGIKYNTATEPSKALADERAKIPFNVRELTYFIDGSQEATERFEKFMTQIERDPLFANDDFFDMNHEERREVTMARVAKTILYLNTCKTDKERDDLFPIVGLADPSTTTRTFVHFGLFMNGIRGSGTAEQVKYWEEQGGKTVNKMYGCFAMTELGHGSNVAGLETTATYDEVKDQFVINTPNLGASKWWIGGAAHTATHTLCFARLIVRGKDYGVKNFVVPLRNVDNHSLLAGIAVGDIGKKMGRDGVDNGWIQFSNVRIPRSFMLMKFAKVDKKGNVTQPPLAQLAYGALIGGRVSMAADSYQVSKRFITIAVRYAAARRQFASGPDQPETKLLDYPYHQRRLLPRLAYTYAMRTAADGLYDYYYNATNKLANTDVNNKAALNSAIEDIKEVFTLSAGLKAFSTWGCGDIIDEARQSCGGHGYSSYNGFGNGYSDWIVNTIWEGDNNVLTLSTGRSLIQSGLSLRKGKKVGGIVEYLARSEELKGGKLNGNHDKELRDPATIIKAWETVASQAINETVERFVELTTKEKLTPTQAFEELSLQRFTIARVHTRLYVIKSFFARIEKSATDELRQVVLDVALLFSLWSIENESALFLKYNFLTPQDLDIITDLVNEYCKRVRVNAVGLTDAFNLSDYFINASIGHYDGDIYKNYFEKVLRRNPPRDSKAPYYNSLMRPFFHRVDSEEINLKDVEPEE